MYDRLVEEELHAQLRAVCARWYCYREPYQLPGDREQFAVNEAVLPRFGKWSINRLRSTFVSDDSIFVEGLYRRNDAHEHHNLFLIQFSVTSTNAGASLSRYALEPDYNEELNFLANVFNGRPY